VISNQAKESIQNYLEEAKRQLVLHSQSNIPTEPFQALKFHAIGEELKTEVEVISEIIEQSTDVENAFIAHCVERAERNKGSCLSYQEMPEGACNQFIANIYRSIFPSATMDELFKLLMPEVTHCLDINFLVDGKKVKLQFERVEGFSTLAVPEPFNFSNYIIVGDCLLDVSLISLYPFELHHAFYEQIQRDYPAMATVLYEHNPALEILRRELQYAKLQGPAPYRVIEQFAAELRRGGTGQTGEYYSSNAAQQAFTDFKNYLALLPDHIRTQLLSLSNSNHNLDWIINVHLGRNVGCVEIASMYLTTLLQTHAASEILTRDLTLTPERRRALKLQYGPHAPLVTHAVAPRQGQSRKIPALFLENADLDHFLELTTKEYLSIIGNFIHETTDPALAYHRDYCFAFKLLTELYQRTYRDDFGVQDSLNLLIQAINSTQPTPEVLRVIQCTNEFLLGRMTREDYLRESARLKSTQNVKIALKNAMVNVLAGLMFCLVVAAGFAIGFVLGYAATGFTFPVIGIMLGVFMGFGFIFPAAVCASKITKSLHLNHSFFPLPQAMLNISRDASSELIASHQVPATFDKSNDEPIPEESDDASLGMIFR